MNPPVDAKSKPWKVMLACNSEDVVAHFDELQFPLLASRKLDGVRAHVHNGVVWSRSNKPIPNKHVQAMFKHLEHYDGELICGDPTSPTCYRDTVSAVMRTEGEPNVTYWVFDYTAQPLTPFSTRRTFLETDRTASVEMVQQVMCFTLGDILSLEKKWLKEGYEGVILRAPHGHYKHGRSTFKDGLLLKLKRFIDGEAEIIGFEERMRNENEATTDEVGHTHRSSHKANKLGRGDLGALRCRTREGVEFSCGTGFDDGLRAEIWAAKEKYLGKIIKFKHFEIGAKDKPRHPVFLGFRDRKDM